MKKAVRHLMLILLGFFLGGSLVFAGGENEITTEQGREQQVVLQSIKVLHSWASTPNPETLEVIFNRFEELNPQYKIDDNPIPFEEYTKMIKIIMPSKSPPDVIVHKPGSNTRAQIDAGLYLDLTDFWEEQNFDSVLPEYAKGLWTRHGKIWGVPFKGQVLMVWYRPSIFKKVGLKAPTNWDEFKQVCAKLKNAGYVPLNAGDKNPWPATYWFEDILLMTAGKAFWDNLMLGRAKWTDPRVIKAFEILKRDILDPGYYMANANAYSYQEASRNFGEGKAAIYNMGSWLPPRLWAVMPDVDMDYFLFPTIDSSVERTLRMQGDGWAIPRKAINVQGAKDLIAFLSTKWAHVTFAANVGEPVLHKETTADLYPHPDELGAATLERFKYNGVNPLDLGLEPIVANEVQNLTAKFNENPDMESLMEDLKKIDEVANKVFSDIEKEVAKGFWK